MLKMRGVFLSLYRWYKKFSFYRSKFFSYRYFVRNYEEIEEIYIDEAKRKVIFNKKECYFPRKIPENSRLLKRNYFWDGKQRHLVELPGRYSKSHNGNTIYTIPLVEMSISKEKNSIFGFSKEELEDKIIVIEVDSNDNVVLPDEPGKALYYSFSGSIKPTSFRIANRKTGETRWIPSLIMLPFNLIGAVFNFSFSLAGGILNKMGGTFLFLSKKIAIFSFSVRPILERTSFLRRLIPIKCSWICMPISKSLDDKIDADKNGVLKSSQKLLKITSILICIFESIASFFIAAGSIIEGVGYTTDAVLRTTNLVFYHDDLAQKATWANIKSSVTGTYYDLYNVWKYTISSFQACKTRINSKIDELHEIKSVNTNKGTGNKTNKQNFMLNNLSNMNQNKIKEAGRGLRDAKKSTITVGTEKRLNNSHCATSVKLTKTIFSRCF